MVNIRVSFLWTTLWSVFSPQLERNSVSPGTRKSPCGHSQSAPGPFESAKNARQPVSRVLSAPREAGRPFLWDASRDAPHATNPGGGTGTPPRLSRYRDIAAAPIRSCSRWGLPCRPCCQGRGALLPHRFALARGTGEPVLHGRFAFCGTIPGVAPAGR
jgi:hypothetical protein